MKILNENSFEQFATKQMVRRLLKLRIPKVFKNFNINEYVKLSKKQDAKANEIVKLNDNHHSETAEKDLENERETPEPAPLAKGPTIHLINGKEGEESSIVISFSCDSIMQDEGGDDEKEGH